MVRRSLMQARGWRGFWHAALFTTLIAILLSNCVDGQTTFTGALTGMALDPSGSVMAGVVLVLTDRETGHSETATSDEQGRFSFLLLSPGVYPLIASKNDFVTLTPPLPHYETGSRLAGEDFIVSLYNPLIFPKMGSERQDP
jgi:hypothetical protein